MGHIGLTPQSLHMMGGFKVQGRTAEAARALVDDAKALVSAGCFAIVLEGVPDAVARLVTESISVPTIGIGAGAACDGQVLVIHDLLGLEDRVAPKFVRRYASLEADGVAAVAAFVSDVRDGGFPSDGESYHLTDDVADVLGLYAGVALTSRTLRHAEQTRGCVVDCVARGRRRGAPTRRVWRVRRHGHAHDGGSDVRRRRRPSSSRRRPRRAARRRWASTRSPSRSAPPAVRRRRSACGSRRQTPSARRASWG